jgi:hypothetical protein
VPPATVSSISLGRRRACSPSGHGGRGRTAMGHSEFDPGAQRRPWNAGRKLGANRALKPHQVWGSHSPMQRCSSQTFKVSRSALPTRRRIAELRIEQILADHGEEPRIDLAVLAMANPVNGRAHIVVDSAPRRCEIDRRKRNFCFCLFVELTPTDEVAIADIASPQHCRL